MYGSEQTMAMARVLLERGADPNAINRMGNVPLSEAVVNNRIEFVKLLLEFGVSYNFQVLLINIVLILWIRILLSPSKNSNKNLDSYCFVTSF